MAILCAFGLIVGGVGCNKRLQGMMADMCRGRGAEMRMERPALGSPVFMQTSAATRPSIAGSTESPPRRSTRTPPGSWLAR